VFGVEHQVSKFSAITRTSGFGKDFKTFCQSATKIAHDVRVFFWIKIK